MKLVSCFVSSHEKLAFLHDNGNEDGGPQSLEQDVAKRLKDGVCDKEDGQGSIVFPRVCGAQALDVSFETGDFGVANVGTIEERYEVQQGYLKSQRRETERARFGLAYPWHEPEIKLPE